VRSLATQADVAAVAARIDGAILASPIGDARATRMTSPESLLPSSPSATMTVTPPSGVLDMSVTATGAASARRTPNGWLLSREEGAAAWSFVAWGVDDHLRVGNVGVSLDPLADETIRHPLGH
jgi:hypothetical protein